MRRFSQSRANLRAAGATWGGACDELFDQYKDNSERDEFMTHLFQHDSHDEEPSDAFVEGKVIRCNNPEAFIADLLVAGLVVRA